jgi:hypothetical protein
MPRIYLHCIERGEFWLVRYLEADLKTSVGRIYHYPCLDRVRELLTRANADAARPGTTLKAASANGASGVLPHADRGAI